ncbi:hypothetical protein Sjap_024739 [Stephania japonica]|uniref:Protein kinase domain-containing protein n=1 Tax=Stephania japonica TaxID=461633 RepID=A0AAP0EIU3_9MAGN
MKKRNYFLNNLMKPFKFHSKDQSSREEDLEKIAAQEQKHFPFEILDAATKHFDIQNKLGEGGFGPVYKGKLGDGREIAVKKLSQSSNQGKREFMNEAKLLARVQHRNVVNLLGYCAHTLEKLLVYEYLPHQSLDKFLFSGQRRGELDWKKSGYMAPEYVMHGQLSAKADVFSFGVLVLELITGQKNSTFSQDPDAHSLLEWAWRLYKKGRSLEIMDPTMASEAATDQVEMCIKIGLLCTQADPKLRPTMRRVVVMLSKKPGSIEEPTRPGFPGSRYRRSNRTSAGVHSSSSTAEASTGASSAMTSSSSYISTYNTGSASTSTATTASGAPTPRSLEKRPMQ